MPAKKSPEEKIQNATKRVGIEFDRELEEIKDARIESGVDKKRKSTRKLTNLIIKHNSWPYVREDLIKIKIEGVHDEED
jgi:hypothetical protein